MPFINIFNFTMTHIFSIERQILAFESRDISQKLRQTKMVKFLNQCFAHNSGFGKV